MRSSIFLSACFGASANEDGTSLMQRRFIKQMGNNALDVATSNHAARKTGEIFEVDGSDVVEEPNDVEHVCGTWSDWSECTQSCGGGMQYREYAFETGVVCGESCPHGDGDKQSQECNNDIPCPIDCVGDWQEYSDCSVSCGEGLQQRSFKITQPAMHGGQHCARTNGAVEDHTCSNQICDVNCEGHWDDWGECSNGGTGPHGLECGPGGVQHRTYSIKTPKTDGGCGCLAAMFGTSVEVAVDETTTDTRSCELPCCPEPCEGEWGEYGECEGDNVQQLAVLKPQRFGYGGYQPPPKFEACCGGGQKTKSFTVSKDLVCGGEKCKAADGATKKAPCCETPCPVDCEGHWGEASQCCSDCGGGQTEAVYIITQKALHGGEQCPHKAGDLKHEPCNTQPCPVPCEGDWGEWEQCTDECGPDGTQTRDFVVTQIALHGGEECQWKGQKQIQSCDPEPVPCPIDAVCAWTAYTECSAPCFDTQAQVEIIKTREWVQISEAKYGGKECLDSPPAKEPPQAVCHMPPCPIPCIGSWGEYDKCNAEVSNECAGGHFCGRGTRTKTYAITQAAEHGGEECPHEDGHKESKVCGDVPCQIDCEGNFTEWGDCCSTCGGGSQSREYVIHVAAQHGGCKCDMIAHVEHRACNENPCPIDCVGKWNEWTKCDKKCTDCRNNGDVGSTSKTYEVVTPAQFGGLECPFKDGEVKTKTCNEKCCPEDCEGSWTEFGDCSTSCGGGVTERTYHITHKAAHGGKRCPYCDEASHTKQCEDTKPCPIDCYGEFDEWTDCTANCGGGTTTSWFIPWMWAQHGGKECDYLPYEEVTKECNTQECPVDCRGNFGLFGECTAECGGGAMTRTYTIVQPAENGGDACSSAEGDEHSIPCNTFECPKGYQCPPKETKPQVCNGGYAPYAGKGKGGKGR